MLSLLQLPSGGHDKAVTSGGNRAVIAQQQQRHLQSQAAALPLAATATTGHDPKQRRLLERAAISIPMASPHDCRARRPCPHSHTHHHSEAQSNTRLHHCPHCPLRLHCRHCPLHSHHFRNNFQPLPPPYVAPLPQNLHSSGAVQYKEASASAAQISQELQHVELDDEQEDDEPIFVLTDEWREFFAQSEARRKQEKKGRK